MYEKSESEVELRLFVKRQISQHTGIFVVQLLVRIIQKINMPEPQTHKGIFVVLVITLLVRIIPKMNMPRTTNKSP